MAFWTYMLHCRGGLFYVGHTDDLERRIAEHQSGLIAGFTADHLPVELVWSESFQTRDDAKAAERKLKGWSRDKKLALIRGDWERISALAKKKDSASTSSAQAETDKDRSPISARPELVEGPYFPLLPHPDHPPLAISAISVRFNRSSPHWLRLRWRVEGTAQLVVPDFAGRGRADGLWQTTCFEAFLKAPGGAAYREINLSPSERWAAYDFASYREGMANHPLPRDPDCTARRGGDVLIFDASVPVASLPPLPWALALTAVIEEAGGHKSYWSLAHPPGKPDFHHEACFAALVPAPGAA